MNVEGGSPMKLKWKWTRMLAAFCMAILLPLTGYVSYAAGEWNANQPCSLTVNASSADKEFAEDLKTAEVVVDLYKVADVVKDGDNDNFIYNFREEYSSLLEASFVVEGTDGSKSLRKDLTSDEWRQMAQKAAQIALDSSDGSLGRPGEQKKEPVVAGAGAGTPITKEASEGDQGNNLYAGLYLMVARGEDVEEYIVPISREGRNAGIGTVAWSENKVYTFEPELVALPGVLTGGDLSQGAEGGYAWNYNVTVNLKPSQSERFGYLDIVKSLRNYDSSQSAVFVFQVDAVQNGRSVYSDVWTIELNGTGPRRLPAPVKLPAGAQVTVREIYATPCYTLVEKPVNPTASVGAEHTADSPLTFTFVSDYNPKPVGGKIITNQFTYDGTESQWKVVQIGDLKEVE